MLVLASPSVCFAFAKVALFSRSASPTAEHAEAKASARNATSALTYEERKSGKKATISHSVG